MPAPKSVVKVKIKDGKTSVEYTSNVDAVNYYMFELSRRALNDVAKFIKVKFAENYMKLHPSRSTITTAEGKKKSNVPNLKRQLYHKTWSSKNTQYPRVQIGMNINENTGFNLLWQEIGSSKTRRQGILTNTVKDNVDQIVEIEAQYLSSLGKGNEDAYVNEGEYDGDE